MENQKKKMIIIVCLFILMAMAWIFNTDRYIRDNIRIIDSADSIDIVTEEKEVSCPFDERLIDLLSYGGSIIKVDNVFSELIVPYSNKLTKLDMSIRYRKGEFLLDTADVFQSKENPEEYILHMNNVYWTTHSNLIELLEIIK